MTIKILNGTTTTTRQVVQCELALSRLTVHQIFPCNPIQSSLSSKQRQHANRTADIMEQENKPPCSPVLGHSPIQRISNQPVVSLSSLSASFAFSPSPSKQYVDERLVTKDFGMLRDNLYDYQDPWNAIGVILGLEDAGQDARTPNPSPPGHKALEHLFTERSESPDDDAASAHSQHSHDTFSSTHSRRSSIAKPAQRTASNLSIDNASSYLYQSLPLTPVRGSARTSASEHPLDISSRPSEFTGIKYFTISGLERTNLHPNPLADSRGYSPEPNPSILLLQTRPEPFSPLDDFQDDEMPVEQIHTPSPGMVHPLDSPFRGVYPKFEKFPLVPDLMRNAKDRPVPLTLPARTFKGFKIPVPKSELEYRASSSPSSLGPAEQVEHLAAAPFVDTSRSLAFPSPKQSPKLEYCASPPPPSISFESTEQAEHRDDMRSVEENQYTASPYTQRPLRIECSDDVRGADMPIVPPQPAEHFFEEGVVDEHEEECTQESEKFFGSLSLFSDDIDEPDSDD
jgi:hypothetical protein